MASGRIATVIATFLLCFVGASRSQTTPRVVHVFVALADNQYQGIIPVPAQLGNGFDPDHNLYWGAEAGVKTYFARSPDWKLLECTRSVKAEVMERCVFSYRKADVYLVADAYRGDQIKRTILDFLDAAAGNGTQTVHLSARSGSASFLAAGGANLIVYVGHDGLMDFQVPRVFPRQNKGHRDAIILSCASRQYFYELLRTAGAYPVLWTTNLMAPEAYTLKYALDGWIAGESGEQLHELAAVAYDRYQKCGMKAARRLFATGW